MKVKSVCLTKIQLDFILPVTGNVTSCTELLTSCASQCSQKYFVMHYSCWTASLVINWHILASLFHSLVCQPLTLQSGEERLFHQGICTHGCPSYKSQSCWCYHAINYDGFSVFSRKQVCLRRFRAKSFINHHMWPRFSWLYLENYSSYWHETNCIQKLKNSCFWQYPDYYAKVVRNQMTSSYNLTWL